MADRSVRRTRPGPVDALIERIGELAHAPLVGCVAVEIGGGREHAGEQECAVDGRDFGVECAATALEVEEVVVEAAIAACVGFGALRALIEERQRREHTAQRVASIEKAAFDGDRIGRERKSGRGDARRPIRGIFVAHESIGWVRLIDEVTKRFLLDKSKIDFGHHVSRGAGAY